MKTFAYFFPFDLFGSGGTRAGAHLLADAFRELLDDVRREKSPVRSRAFNGKVRIEEQLFDSMADYEDWRSGAREAFREIRENSDFFLWVSGNHLGVLPIYDELAATKNVAIVQFDAHLDVHRHDDCTEQLSHGNFLLHIDGPTPRIVNVGHRDLTQTESALARTFVQTISSAELAIEPEKALAKLRDSCGDAEQIVIDIDCDVFDPAYFPGAAAPVPYGLSPRDLLRCLDTIGWRKIQGIAISEFDPVRDVADRSLETLMWLIEYALLQKHERRPSTR